ncbi:VOC family protein [Hymenobacter cellulosilyticus]|uniref:VOC family protein n=1 Tax=Hymenobacter cellulosilyticus TaxID=2932248 RepID=A0A8T9QA68_9BACT|nr:VOC family protein [Hymenobacter cellulosilyticus]UOQ72710.1 VOC family protein [Hymenobacter cellulosilyticus]
MKTPRLTPYLTFNGTCRAAMTFYQQCLGGDLMIQPFAGTPAAEQVGPEGQESVLHAILTTEDLVLMASDAGMHQITKGNMISLSVNCQSEEEIAALFRQFAEGGTIIMPLEDTFWGARFGMLTDQFGIDWMFNYDKPAAQ